MGQASKKRGGSWNNNPNECRSANRNNNNPRDNNNNIGFRVVSRTLYCQNLNMGIFRVCLKESRLVPVMQKHPKINQSQLA